jgi:hypothetical protein
MKKAIVGIGAVAGGIGLFLAGRRVTQEMREHIKQMKVQCKQMAAAPPAGVDTRPLEHDADLVTRRHAHRLRERPRAPGRGRDLRDEGERQRPEAAHEDAR